MFYKEKLMESQCVGECKQAQNCPQSPNPNKCICKDNVCIARGEDSPMSGSQPPLYVPPGRRSPYTNAEIQKKMAVTQKLRSRARNFGVERSYFPPEKGSYSSRGRLQGFPVSIQQGLRRSHIDDLIMKRKNVAKGLSLTGPMQHSFGDLRDLITDHVVSCNELSGSGKTILMQAVSLGDVELVEKVLEVCPNLDLHCNMRSDSGAHVLDFLRAHTPQNQLKIINLLKARGMYCSANMCNEILIRVLGPHEYKLSILEAEPFSLKNYRARYDERGRLATDHEHKTNEDIMVDVALKQLQCPGVDLDYKDENEISIGEYAAARNIPIINQAIRMIRNLEKFKKKKKREEMLEEMKYFYNKKRNKKR